MLSRTRRQATFCVNIDTGHQIASVIAIPRYMVCDSVAMRKSYRWCCSLVGSREDAFLRQLTEIKSRNLAEELATTRRIALYCKVLPETLFM